MNIDYLAISYDNKLFIPVDISADGNCLFRSLVESNINPSIMFPKGFVLICQIVLIYH